MATSTSVALSEYLRRSYRPDREWVDGELRESSKGELSHAIVQKYFFKLFLLREDELAIRVYAELRLQVAETNFRVPDLLVLRESDPAEQIVRVPPMLCVEVLSPEDRMSDIGRRVSDYLVMGVGMVWVIDPRRRAGFMTIEGVLTETEELLLARAGLRVRVSDCFTEIDRLADKRQA